MNARSEFAGARSYRLQLLTETDTHEIALRSSVFSERVLLVREYRGDWGKAQYSTTGFLRNRQPCTLAASLRYSSKLNGYKKNRSALSGLQEG